MILRWRKTGWYLLLTAGFSLGDLVQVSYHYEVTPLAKLGVMAPRDGLEARIALPEPGFVASGYGGWSHQQKDPFPAGQLPR